MVKQPIIASIGQARMLNIAQLRQLQQKPAPFEPGEPLFWDDPHISTQMRAAHLDPALDAANRRPETIDLTVDWLIATLALRPGQAVLDLGCGPGLYAARLARRGLHVTGVDYLRRSIACAQDCAREHNLDIAYRYQNYLDFADDVQYDAALLIYGDFCPLAPDLRARLLAVVHDSLRPGGQFALDVSTRVHRSRHGLRTSWYATESGFWRPDPHLVLEQGFDYPEQDLYLDQYVVLH